MHFRTTDNAKWGVGKGANLTPAEVDGNFWDLDQRTAALEASSPEPVGIAQVTVTGSTFTIVLTDGSSRRRCGVNISGRYSAFWPHWYSKPH